MALWQDKQQSKQSKRQKKAHRANNKLLSRLTDKQHAVDKGSWEVRAEVPGEEAGVLMRLGVDPSTQVRIRITAKANCSTTKQWSLLLLGSCLVRTAYDSPEM